mmetsp:Transcript_19563/g.63516  ORF Transcript_19563/g.63516 Transcript_19563/m.63516 type:complete len:214 (+) Transcript_19563:524-1165(+)
MREYNGETQPTINPVRHSAPMFAHVSWMSACHASLATSGLEVVKVPGSSAEGRRLAGLSDERRCFDSSATNKPALLGRCCCCCSCRSVGSDGSGGDGDACGRGGSAPSSAPAPSPRAAAAAEAGACGGGPAAFVSTDADDGPPDSIASSRGGNAVNGPSFSVNTCFSLTSSFSKRSISRWSASYSRSSRLSSIVRKTSLLSASKPPRSGRTPL